VLEHINQIHMGSRAHRSIKLSTASNHHDKRIQHRTSLFFCYLEIHQLANSQCSSKIRSRHRVFLDPLGILESAKLSALQIFPSA
jgi:hypothetical protein